MSSSYTIPMDETEYEGFTSMNEGWSSQRGTNNQTLPSRYRPVINAKKAMRAYRLPEAEDIAKIINKWKGEYPQTFAAEIKEYKSKRAIGLLADTNHAAGGSDYSAVDAIADAEAEWQALEEQAEVVRQEKLTASLERRRLRTEQSAAQASNKDEFVARLAGRHSAPAETAEAALESDSDGSDERFLLSWQGGQLPAKNLAAMKETPVIAPSKKREKVILQTGKAMTLAPVAVPRRVSGLPKMQISSAASTNAANMPAPSVAIAGIPGLHVKEPTNPVFPALASLAPDGGRFPAQKLRMDAPGKKSRSRIQRTLLRAAQAPEDKQTQSFSQSTISNGISPIAKVATAKREFNATNDSARKAMTPFSRTDPIDLDSEMTILALALESAKRPEARDSILRQMQACAQSLSEKNGGSGVRPGAVAGPFAPQSIPDRGRIAVASMMDRDRSASPVIRVQQGYRSRSPPRLIRAVYATKINTHADKDDENADKLLN